MEKWLKFLVYPRDSKENMEILMEYFFTNFAKLPYVFYKFLVLIKENLDFSTRISSDKKHLARRYLEVIAPLCQRFGFNEMRDILSDVSFELLYPQKYASIGKALLKYERQSKKVIHRITERLQEILNSEKIKGTVLGRYKKIHSIAQKMEKKRKEEIFSLRDIFAFRIILENPNPAECFHMLNLLHDHFTPLPERFKDYITIPKINGYQSLHTGLTNVISGLSIPIEVQIRTRVMNDFAEKGLAAHWFYSQKKKTELLSQKEAYFVRYFSFLSQKESTNIYFFSYERDLFRMEHGATVLDFAYFLHTDLGNKASFARVNGQKEELNYGIQEGDNVEIIKSQENQVSRNWLDFVFCRNTLRRISLALKDN